MRFIVTGAGGFIGWHLVSALGARGDAVQAWTRSVEAADRTPAVDSVGVDITDRTAVFSALKAFDADIVVHLAAQSLPGRSWDDPVGTYKVNVIGALNLLDAVRALPKPPRVLLAGSSAEYAEPADGRPIAEDAATEPNSPYASSKLAADQLAQLYFRRYALDLVRFRPFYLIGPRKIGDVCSDFARRVVAIERGEQNVMRVGALDIVRDIIDVRDGVDGLLHIVGAGQSGELYNICGGGGVSIGQILETYRQVARVPFEVVPDPNLMRPLEQKMKIGDSSKLRALGWKPRHSLNDSLHAILDYWRQM